MDSSPVVDTMQQNGTTRKRKRDLAPALDGDLPESESKRKSQNTEDTLTAGHPFGVRPIGNLFFSGKSEQSIALARIDGLGSFSILPDDLILSFLSYIERAEDLCALMATSKFFYVFCQEQENWKERVLAEFKGDWDFVDSWKNTYIKRRKPDFTPLPPLSFKLDNLFSEILFHSWRCLSTDLYQFALTENIDRRSNLSAEEFLEQYGKPNKPVIITDVVKNWPAFTEWTKEKLIEKYGEIEFQVGKVSQTLKRYFQYCAQTQDDTPLYLFDNSFGEKAPTLLQDYEVPVYFRKDYFELIEEPHRPSYRWLLIGPPRSGSTFHQDPNQTSAWNALISGAKKWVLYPPDVTPPGVIPSADMQLVTTTISVSEWFINFYRETKKSKAYKPIECVQRPGDLIFIPHGWWHAALNLEESIAVTQNVVNDENLLDVVDFLRKKEKPDVWIAFEDALRKKDSKAHERVMQHVSKREEERRSRQEVASLFSSASSNSVWTLGGS